MIPFCRRLEEGAAVVVRMRELALERELAAREKPLARSERGHVAHQGTHARGALGQSVLMSWIT